MFRKAHYEALAELMQRLRTYQGDTPLDHLEDLLVELFKENPDFKPDRFRRACRPGANVRARTR